MGRLYAMGINLFFFLSLGRLKEICSRLSQPGEWQREWGYLNTDNKPHFLPFPLMTCSSRANNGTGCRAPMSQCVGAGMPGCHPGLHLETCTANKSASAPSVQTGASAPAGHAPFPLPRNPPLPAPWQTPWNAQINSPIMVGCCCPGVKAENQVVTQGAVIKPQPHFSVGAL